MTWLGVLLISLGIACVIVGERLHRGRGRAPEPVYELRLEEDAPVPAPSDQAPSPARRSPEA